MVLSGFFQPKMNYSAAYCNYDCTVCGEVCPTGALRKLEKPEKKLTQIGKAEFQKDDCIVNNEEKRLRSLPRNIVDKSSPDGSV